jgi:Undecaprenyl-phosphate glucose phosphotransferase
MAATLWDVGLKMTQLNPVDTVIVAPRRRIGVSYHFVEPILMVADATIIVLASDLGGAGYQLSLNQTVGDLSVYTGLGLVSSACYAASAHYLSLYSLPKLLRRRGAYWQVMGGWATVLLFLAVVVFLLKIGNEISRGSVICFGLLSAVGLVGWRRVVKRGVRTALRIGAIHGRRTVVVGTQSELAWIVPDYMLQRYGIEEVDRVVLRPGRIALHNQQAEIEDVPRRARQCRAEQIILALPWEETAKINIIRESFRVSPLPVRLLPDHFIRSILKSGGAPASLLIELQRAPLTRLEQCVKRLFDIAVATIALLILSPLMLLTAAVIKFESGGAVIFQQRRNGFNNQPFVIYKFRTMSVAEDGSKITQARKSDPRVTKFGRILRRTSIDELPQLFNVLKGDMSIVGPRPHALAHDDEYGQQIAEYAFRGHVKPGITGWAQVNGLRGGTERLEQMSKRVKFDLWYINNWSFLLDLQIVVRTVFELAQPRNAY